jgi:hypothetical protein
MALPDLNEGIADLPPNTLLAADAGEQLAGGLTAALQQPVILIQSDDDTPVRRSPRRRQPEEPPAKKTTVTVTYERRRSERLKVKLVRVDSVERATQRKASSRASLTPLRALPQPVAARLISCQTSTRPLLCRSQCAPGERHGKAGRASNLLWFHSPRS